MTITKLAVAERLIVASVRTVFGGGDPVPAYLLAASARAITSALCDSRGICSFLDDALKHYPSLSKNDLYRMANRHAGLFKHADRDPEAELENFTDEQVDEVLFIAAHDFGRLCQGMPIEAQIFEAWFLVLQGVAEAELPELAKLFPGLRGRPRFDQVAEGGRVLKQMRSDPAFKMSYSLAAKPTSTVP